MSKDLPILDMAPVRAWDDAGARRFADEVREACTGLGFFYVRNHGVPQATIDTAVATAQAFFDLPVETKRRVKVNQRHRGFNALGDALMYEAKKPDHKEFYTMGLELPEDDPDVLAGQPLRGPNNWPDFMPEVRRDMSAYYDAIGACGADLLRGVALSLGVAPDFFDSRYVKRLQRTQAVFYPPQPPDLGADTLLWQDDNGGLEVRTVDGKWIPAPPVPGTLVINVADLLGRWTNDRYASTPHRVVNRSGRRRFSIATFYDPDFDAVVDPRDFPLPAGMEPRYEPVRAGDHIVGRLDRSFGYRKRQQVAAE
jgi:isopenicillin N synthase-like dioxygenase